MLPLASSIKHAWKKQVHDGKQNFCLDKGDTSLNDLRKAGQNGDSPV
jgi:hypothetical protein